MQGGREGGKERGRERGREGGRERQRERQTRPHSNKAADKHLSLWRPSARRVGVRARSWRPWPFASLPWALVARGCCFSEHLLFSRSMLLSETCSFWVYTMYALSQEILCRGMVLMQKVCSFSEGMLLFSRVMLLSETCCFCVYYVCSFSGDTLDAGYYARSAEVWNYVLYSAACFPQHCCNIREPCTSST